MFTRLTSLVSSAVDALAPTTRTKEQAFQDHWRHICSFFDAPRDAHAPLPSHISETNVPYHLENMIKYIKEEEVETMEDDQTGPCMEFLLQRRVLELLVEYGKPNKPAGMLAQVLRTFSLLMSNIRQRLLPENSVRVPLIRLVEYSFMIAMDEATSSDAFNLKLELVKLINTVFRLLRKNPVMINLFFETDMRGQKEPKFKFFSLLLDFLSTPGMVGKLAREAIIFGLKMTEVDDRLEDFVVSHSLLCPMVAENLGVLYCSLPTHPEQIDLDPKYSSENLAVSNSNISSPAPTPSPVSPSRPSSNVRSSSGRHRPVERKQNSTEKLEQSPNNTTYEEEFFALWGFANSISALGIGRVTTKLIDDIRVNFLDAVIVNAILQYSEYSATAATLYFIEMIKHATDPLFLDGVIQFLFGRPRIQPNCDGSSIDERVARKRLFETMLNRVSESPEPLALATLRLFDTLMDASSVRVYEELILQDFVTIYPNPVPVSSELMQMSETHRRIQRLLSFIPLGYEEMFGARAFSRLDEYFMDAQDRCQNISGMFQGWNSPQPQAITGLQSPSETQVAILPRLLRFLFQSLSAFDTQSYERNLFVTSMISRLLVIPYAPLHAFLVSESYFDQMLDTHVREASPEERRTLQFMRLLEEVCNRVQAMCVDIRSMDARLKQMKQRLSIEDDSETLSPLSGELRPEDERVLMSYVLLQEFCKEIAAVCMVSASSFAYAAENDQMQSRDTEIKSPPSEARDESETKSAEKLPIGTALPASTSPAPLDIKADKGDDDLLGEEDSDIMKDLGGISEPVSRQNSFAVGDPQLVDI